MKNTYTNSIKQNIDKLGLVGNNVTDKSFIDHLFLDDWIISNKKGPQRFLNGLPWTGQYVKKQFFLDKANSYYINSLGFRGEEFSKENDLVFSGCSFTFGLGLPEKEIWGSRVANSLNMKYSNLGLPGNSVVAIINNIYKYFKEYGHPKILLCLFPDFYRFIIPINTETLITKNTRLPVESDKMLSPVHIIYQESEKYSKKPHYAENVFSPDIPFFYSYQYIKMLEEYCKQTNILFLWSTWNGIIYELILQQKNISKNFVYLNSNRWIKDEEGLDIYLDGCIRHEHLKQFYPNNFDGSTDIENEALYPKTSRHSGVHKNIHWAEEFLQKIQLSNIK